MENKGFVQYLQDKMLLTEDEILNMKKNRIIELCNAHLQKDLQEIDGVTSVFSFLLKKEIDGIIENEEIIKGLSNKVCK
ncbi:hypothetical protein SAMN05216498_1059 [Tenuibacillus multivorans]|uniref:Uncharacterized protein n=2 Tax=Tenuibacillus multivorans TaxID=237069 RepID=A0A1G9XRE9_9BACI|nr:hypothetical protein [Tenuibacillus multivorans]SDM98755.1 hypothetical protein SAMN05216498_1059 [Tenuibacillus multivorans]